MGGFCQSLLIMSSSSYFPSSSLLYSSHIKHVKNSKKGSRAVVTVACLKKDNQNEGGFFERRPILVLGISALSFLQLRARAVENQVKEKGNENKKFLEEESRPNSFLSLLNVMGIIGSGVLGSLYALAQKEKKATEMIIESLKKRVDEKEAAILSLERDFEKKLLNEKEERAKQTRKAKEGERFLSNQLSSANSTVTELRLQLQSEKHIVEELKGQISRLQTDITKAVEDNKMLESKMKEKLDLIEVQQDRVNLLSLEMKDKEENLQNLNSLLAEKELERNNLDSIYKQAKADLTEANSKIITLKEEILKTQKELDSKNAALDDLNMRMSSLVVERDELTKRVEYLKADFDTLKSDSEKEAALAAELLTKREHELQQLEEQLKLALDEASRNQDLVNGLTQERDDLRAVLGIKINDINNLRYELKIVQEALETSRTEASDLSKQLEQSRKSCEVLTSEVSKIKSEFVETRESLERTLEEAVSSSKVLSDELALVKKALEKSKEELQVMSEELILATESSESLKKELLDVYKKAETATGDLKEERKIIASLRKEVEAAEKQTLKDREARQHLETDLEEATASLDELNRNVLMLSRELEMEKTSVASLETEKEMLYNSLMDQKKVSREAQENVEDAHNLIMKLGKERENLEKRVKKLDKELATAKGEILRLRSEMNSSKRTVNHVARKKSVKDEESNATVTAKRNGRRRRSAPSSETSQ